MPLAVKVSYEALRWKLNFKSDVRRMAELIGIFLPLRMTKGEV